MRKRDGYGRYTEGGHSYEWLLEYDEVRKWINDYSSRITREGYLRALEYFLKYYDTTPDRIVAIGREDKENNTDKVKEMLWVFLQKEYLRDGKHGAANKIKTGVCSFLRRNKVPLVFTRAENQKMTLNFPRNIKRYIPKKHEVYKMADVAPTLRIKALVMSAFQSGCRPYCIRNWDWKLVRKYLYPTEDERRELEELNKLTGGYFTKDGVRIPVRLKITLEYDNKISKYGLGFYYTFLWEEAATILKIYLDDRMQHGWTPQSDDYLFISEGLTELLVQYVCKTCGKEFTSKKQVSKHSDSHIIKRVRQKRKEVIEDIKKKLSSSDYSRVIKKCARKIGLLQKGDFWAKLLRHAFRKVVRECPTLDEEEKEVLMGHKLKGSQGNYFDFHSVDEFEKKCFDIDFSRESVSRFQALQEKTKDQNSIITRQQEEIDTLKEELQEMKEIFGKIKDKLHLD